MLALIAILAASSLVSAAPAAYGDNVARHETLDDHQAAALAKRDFWSNGWYNTFVKGAVDCYSAPTYDSDKVSYYKPGSSVAIGCQTHGEDVNGNDVWDFTIRKCYVPNDQLKIDHVWIPGVDDCDAK
jgi:hypothetical protein